MTRMKKSYTETPNFKCWLGDDDVIRSQWTPGTYITYELAKQTVAPVAEFNKEKQHPLLSDLDGIKGMAREARVIFSEMDGPSAVALVGGSPIARVIGNMFIGLNKQTKLPLRMFANEKEALNWLKDYKR